MDKLYKNIKERRKALKITQQELAEKIGLYDVPLIRVKTWYKTGIFLL